MRLFEAYGHEAKATELLKRKTFRLAEQGPPMAQTERRRLTQEILTDGTAPNRQRLTAMGQAKIEYCRFALDLVRRHGGRVFATMVPQSAPRPPASDAMRKDYAFLFERFFHFLNGQPGDPMGFLILAEMDKSASHVLLGQVSQYFQRTKKGRSRAHLIVPEPFFVHSDLTTLVQIADIVAYTVSWGLRLRGMPASPRPELAPLVQIVERLRYKHNTEGGETVWGIKEIRDLRPKETGRK